MDIREICTLPTGTKGQFSTSEDKVWSRKVKEMSYDIEDTIDTYMMRCKGREPVEQHGFKKAIDKTLKWFRQHKIRRKIATEIREIKSHVIEVHERRRRYEVSLGVDKPVTVDPRLFAQYMEVKELVGIDEARDELISKIMIEENEVPKKQGKIVSIVGFGGLGKTTLANAVYKKIRAQFDCYAFVSVSQTPDLKKLYNSLLHDLSKNINDETLDERQLIEVLREFLEDKRYFVVVDDVWDISVWKMIRCALPDNDNMRKILSFSYYELPCHLRACLLYLSMFPEDYKIEKDRLIRMWIGEGFMQSKKAGKSLFELGESYFNELINRSMIQPIHDSRDDMISSCCVHDMVLDLIRSLSSEEKFVTVLSNMGGSSPTNTIRRLSLQNGQKSHVMAQATWSLQHARSVVVFPVAASLVPPLDCCRVLRVLDLKDCNLSQANSILKCLANIHHLRYLGLRRTGIAQLPEEIGSLQLLQTLDVRLNEISRLPSSVVQLSKLMCLYIDRTTIVPNGIGNLTCLEQLSCLRIDDSTRNIIEQLGQLTELRQLHIRLTEPNGKLLECLCKLQKMEELFIKDNHGPCSIGVLDAWVAPRHLRVLCTQGSYWFSTLPAWVNPSLLPDLTQLCIDVRELHQADLEILGRLPALRYLSLEVDNRNHSIIQRFVVGADAFSCLVSCYFSQFVWPVVFQQGAMPRLRALAFWMFYVRETRGITCNDGLGNLPSLQHVQANLLCDGAGKEEAEQAKAALMHEAERHPNHPCHDIYLCV
uniref:Uncharacterized protein n=1 Tax=Setaria viridis TaxID=4556 RepID=A0A4U6TLF0_SETVI|nr:hypothetical protein SEVIR_8G209100v2 [Setaria viridis]